MHLRRDCSVFLNSSSILTMNGKLMKHMYLSGMLHFVPTRWVSLVVVIVALLVPTV